MPSIIKGLRNENWKGLFKKADIMNREIKFRGSRKDSREWIFGNLLTSEKDVSGNYKAFIVWSFASCHNTMEVEVDPESVGQFTGLKDKNGKEIYERDIVRLTTKFNSYKGLIEYKGDGFIATIPNSDWVDIMPNIWVIGNIYENPELLP